MVVTGFLLTRGELVRLRVRALRRRVWFGLLSRVERGLVDLAIKVVEKARSLVLVRALTGVVKKLLDAMEGEVARLTRTVGRSLAEKLGRIAQGWGNKTSKAWAREAGFVRYLAVTFMNTPEMFRAAC